MDFNSQWFVFTPNPENAEMKTASDCIDYINNGVRWTAKFKDNKFYHYKEGNPSEFHTDDYLEFMDKNKKHCRLEIKNGKMFVSTDQSSSSLKEGKMSYIGWDGKLWTADLLRPISFHPSLNR